jgi:hypothetical protein
LGNKKLSISVEVQDDGGFKIDLSSGRFHGQHKVAETVDSLVLKVTEFLRTELKGEV